jgi:4-diphosphocytidyl-2C-methyl-D-erythritol kinase
VPDFGVSTKDAFGWWDRSSRRSGRDSNDLQAVVAKHHPVVSRLVRALNKEGAFHASLSGSGSAVFGLFSRQSAAQAAGRALAGPRTFVTPTLGRAACRRLAAK